MKSSSFNQYQQYITDNIRYLSTDQYIDLIETVLDRLPFDAINYVPIMHSGDWVKLGIKKMDSKCPFCDSK